MQHLGQFLQGFTQQVGAVIDDHVAELQVHMLPLGSSPGIRGAPASCQSLPGLPAGTGRSFMHLWHKYCVCVRACVCTHRPAHGDTATSQFSEKRPFYSASLNPEQLGTSFRSFCFTIYNSQSQVGTCTSCHAPDCCVQSTSASQSV